VKRGWVPELGLFEEIRGSEGGEVDTPCSGGEYHEPGKGNAEGGAWFVRGFVGHGEISLIVSGRRGRRG